MSVLELLILAVGLAMDSTAVAGTRGLAASHVRVRDAALVGAFFGGFHVLMLLVGAFAGAIVVGGWVTGWSHWVTSIVIGGIGAKMIYEARWRKASDEPVDERTKPNSTATAIATATPTPNPNPFSIALLASLAVATSIDALAVGVTLAVRHTNVAMACAVIGLVVAALSFIGVYAGRRFGALLGRRLDVLGGVTLIGLALKSLVEHYVH